MGPIEEDVCLLGSRMGHPKGARTVVLSSNGMIYLIVLSFGFLQLCINAMPIAGPMGPCDMRWGEALAPCAPWLRHC